jgi:UDP-glucose 4-epimerase
MGPQGLVTQGDEPPVERELPRQVPIGLLLDAISFSFVHSPSHRVSLSKPSSEESGRSGTDLDGKTVLITGATGFLGSHLSHRVVAEGAAVYVVTRTPEASADGPEHWIETPLEDLRPATWTASGAPRFDLVFHLGAFTPKNHAERDRAEDISRSNQEGTRALLSSFPIPPGRIVFASTLDVYGTPTGSVLDERSPLAPGSLYAESKLWCEGALADFARSSGSETVTLRYGHLFGPGEERYEKLIPNTIRRILEGQPPVVVGTGEARQDLLYVDDAVEATVRAAFAPSPPAVINVTRGESHSVDEVIGALVAASGYEGPVERKPATGAEESWTFDPHLMRETLGRWPMVSLEEGLEREVAQWARVESPP